MSWFSVSSVEKASFRYSYPKPDIGFDSINAVLVLNLFSCYLLCPKHLLGYVLYNFIVVPNKYEGH